MKIMFMCMSNTSRSVMAAAMFKRILKRNSFETRVMCQSCGIAPKQLASATDEAVEVMKEIGIDISNHKARKLTVEEINIWDAFFVMDKTHAYILEQAGISKDKIYMTREDIPHSRGVSLCEHRKIRELIKEEVEYFFNKLKVVIEVRDANNSARGNTY